MASQTYADPTTPKKKKKKYAEILRHPVPAERMTGWQENVMDINAIDAKLEATRQIVMRHKE